ncbi:MAG: AraC family transcriptional regulator [Pseudomonadales bacterium]|nr:AraC family transcriptional regulator [Pseudomonadales bacterium]
MLWFHYASSFLAISQLLFMGLFYLLHHHRQLLGGLISLYSFCLIAYIVARMPEVNAELPTLDYLLGLCAIAAPALLWIITHYLFNDEPGIPRSAWSLMIGYFVLRAMGTTFFGITNSVTSTWFWLLFVLPQMIMLGLSIHVVYMAFQGFSDDLIEPRRQLRVPFAIGMGTIVGVIVGSGFFIGNSPLYLDGIYFFIIFLFILSINLTTFRLHKDSPQLIVDNSEKQSIIPVSRIRSRDPDKPLVERIHHAMENERLYAEQGLTIGDLARRVNMQEYRLRRLINQKLHYRNFNQYLNHYRIGEAARRLQDPQETGTAISSIALDVGYASLSSFNKAFKEIHGVTPSFFRSNPQ